MPVVPVPLQGGSRSPTTLLRGKRSENAEAVMDVRVVWALHVALTPHLLFWRVHKGAGFVTILQGHHFCSKASVQER